MFVSRGDMSGRLFQLRMLVCHPHPRIKYGASSSPLPSREREFSRSRVRRLLTPDRFYERASYLEVGMGSSGAVEDRDDLLFYALESLDVTGRDGTEHDLVDTGVNELADSIEDVI